MKNYSILLTHKKNTYSQNGEDGIIAKLMTLLSIERGVFCEFGAWDGIHFSNCRALVQKKWSGIFIEGDPARYAKLVRNYKRNKGVLAINRWVDTRINSLDSILKNNKILKLDFLSIDIDGLDYEIMNSLKIKPRIICVEVNAGHGGLNKTKISTAISKNNIGQSLVTFVKLAEKMGYGLVCYTGNAFFVRKSDIQRFNLRELSAKEAYTQFLKFLPTNEKNRLMLVNLGLETPYYRYLSSDLFPWSIDNNLIDNFIYIFKYVYIDIYKKIFSNK